MDQYIPVHMHDYVVILYYSVLGVHAALLQSCYCYAYAWIMMFSPDMRHVIS